MNKQQVRAQERAKRLRAQKRAEVRFIIAQNRRLNEKRVDATNR